MKSKIQKCQAHVSIRFFYLLLFAPLAVSSASAQDQQEVFWLNDRGIFRASTADLVEKEVVSIEITFPQDVLFDPVANKVYWSDSGVNKIRRANPDGSGIEDVVTEGTPAPQGMALDVAQNKIYWAEASRHAILRANLDGSEVETVVETDTTVQPFDLVLDLDNDVFYWVGSFLEGGIYRTNLDGSGTELIIQETDTTDVTNMALDSVNGKLYWTDLRRDVILRSNLDGSNVEVVIPELDDNVSPYDLFLDVNQGRLYWSDQAKDAIYSANLDGSDIQLIMETDEISDMAVDFENGKIYFVDLFNSKVLSVGLDGANQDVLIEGDINVPEVMALDLVNERVIYKDRWIPQLQSVGFEDGVVSETPFTKRTSIDAATIAVDNRRGKVYWALFLPTAIQRANFDGSMSEQIRMPDDLRPISMTLDVGLERMYWIAFDPDDSSYSFYASDPGLEDVDTLIRPGVIERARGLAIHPGAGKIFWVNPTANIIQRANLDGSDIEDIVTGDIGFPANVAVDLVANKIYWPNYEGNKIQRANLDGTEIEDVMDAYYPEFIALQLPLSVATNLDDEAVSLPEGFSVSGAYPNPFFGSTNLSYAVNGTGTVRIAVYDVLGREIAELENGTKHSGEHDIAWDGRDKGGIEVPAGVYLVRITMDEGEEIVSLVKMN